ncbi:MAG: OmpA family protein [Ectothiorhodospira sp.]
MQKKLHKPMIVSGGGALALALFAAAPVQASTGYTVDPGDTVVRDGSGDCVKTPRWESDLAIEGCPGYEAPEREEPRAEAEPEPEPEPEVTYETVSLDSEVLFATGKSDLTPKATDELDRAADAILDAGDRLERVVVAGHTDSTGSRELNQGLSRDRAESVRDYLVERGVDGDDIVTVGYGEDRPVAYNDTSEGRKANRRVEIRIEKQERRVQRR